MHAASKDAERAKQELEKIRQVDKDAKETHFLAAQIALAEKQPDKAIEELEAALNKEPNKAAIYVDMGRVHASKKDFAAAEAAFRKALEMDPKFNRARIALAQLYATLEKQDQAEQELLLATKADPENEELLHVLGSFYTST